MELSLVAIGAGDLPRNNTPGPLARSRYGWWCLRVLYMFPVVIHTNLSIYWPGPFPIRGDGTVGMGTNDDPLWVARG